MGTPNREPQEYSRNMMGMYAILAQLLPVGFAHLIHLRRPLQRCLELRVEPLDLEGLVADSPREPFTWTPKMRRSIVLI